MCIFSGSVQDVSNTRIFARLQANRQFLVYEMRLVSDADVAMILPLPTPGPREDQVKFISLSDYDHFFDDLDRCFPVERGRGIRGVVSAGGPLVVHHVGAFDASFVPTHLEFSRLDARFRLPETVWRELPAYDDYGFAVFQLRPGEARIHPMAFSFVTQTTDKLYFPTAHVHDGVVHSTAHFDHSLYAQGNISASDWIPGSVLPREVMNFGNFLISDRTRGIVDRESAISRRQLQGELANTDQWISISGDKD